VSYAKQYLTETSIIAGSLDTEALERMVDLILKIKVTDGRIFFLGVGGSAANCSHAVNDFRKILSIEAYAPTDNAAELTARTNDEGWQTVFVEWLKISRLSAKDAVFVLSVGGGSLEKNISANLVFALKYAQSVQAKIIGVLGRDGGFAASVADASVIIPTVNAEAVTPHSEGFQSVVLHLLVSHPKLKQHACKWEATDQLAQ
jgi:D-sedoheptulose 7-phosphate isomerase